MKAQIRPCVLEAIERLRIEDPKYQNDKCLLDAHARVSVQQTKWVGQGAELNKLSLKELALILAGHYEIIDPIEEALRDNPVLNRVQNIVRNQTAKGIEKYGASVQAEDLTVDQWIDHASEEAADLLVYLQVLKEKLRLKNESETDYPSLNDTLQKFYRETKVLQNKYSLRPETAHGRLEVISSLAEIYDVKLDGELYEQ